MSALKRAAACLIALAVLLPALGLAAFALAQLSSVDAAEAAVRLNSPLPTPELIAQTRHAFGLDQPFWTRYAHWLAGLVRGDLGRSFITGEPVAARLLRDLPATLALAAAALGFTLLLGPAAGLACATRPRHPLSRLVRALVLFASSLPVFFAGLLLMWTFALHGPGLPLAGFERPASVVLPALTLSLAFAGAYFRLAWGDYLAQESEPWLAFARNTKPIEINSSSQVGK